MDFLSRLFRRKGVVLGVRKSASWVRKILLKNVKFILSQLLTRRFNPRINKIGLRMAEAAEQPMSTSRYGPIPAFGLQKQMIPLIIGIPPACNDCETKARRLDLVVCVPYSSKRLVYFNDRIYIYHISCFMSAFLRVRFLLLMYYFRSLGYN